MMYPFDGNRYDGDKKAPAGQNGAEPDIGARPGVGGGFQGHDPATTTDWATNRMGVAVSDDEAGRDAGTSGAPRYSRRLSDKILIAFHHACDQADFEVAEQLLQILELMLTRRPLSADNNRRRSMESLVAAHERLWHLRHPLNKLE